MQPPSLIVIAGPSGVGKGTLIKRLMDAYPGSFGFSVSHTTRDPRTGETNGMHYHFSTHEDFKDLLVKDEFVEHAEVHGNFYGTSKDAVKAVQLAGQSCILDIDVQGAKQVKAANLGAFSIFIKPPSMELLRERLVGRGTETLEKVEKRMKNAENEMAIAEKNENGLFDAFIVNDDLEKAFDELKSLVQSPIASQKTSNSKALSSDNCPIL